MRFFILVFSLLFSFKALSQEVRVWLPKGAIDGVPFTLNIAIPSNSFVVPTNMVGCLHAVGRDCAEPVANQLSGVYLAHTNTKVRLYQVLFRMHAPLETGVYQMDFTIEFAQASQTFVQKYSLEMTVRHAGILPVIE